MRARFVGSFLALCLLITYVAKPSYGQSDVLNSNSESLDTQENVLPTIASDLDNSGIDSHAEISGDAVNTILSSADLSLFNSHVHPNVRLGVASWTTVEPKANSELLPGQEVTIHGTFDTAAFYAITLQSDDQSLSILSNWVSPQSNEFLRIVVPVPTTWYAFGVKVSMSVLESGASNGRDAQEVFGESQVQFEIGASFFSVTSTTGVVLTPTVSQLYVNGTFSDKADYACRLVDTATQQVALTTGYASPVDNGHGLSCAIVAELDYVAGNILSVNVLQISNPLEPNPDIVQGIQSSSFELSAYWTTYSDASPQPTPNRFIPGVTKLSIAGSFLKNAFYACGVEVNGAIQFMSGFVVPESDLAAVHCQLPVPVSQYTAGPGATLCLVQGDNAMGSNPTKVISKPVLPAYLEAYWFTTNPAPGSVLTPGVTQLSISGSFDPAKFYRGEISVENDEEGPLTIQSPWVQPLDPTTVAFKFPRQFGYKAGAIASFVLETAEDDQGQNELTPPGLSGVTFALGAYFASTDLADGHSISPHTQLAISGSFLPSRYYLCQLTDPNQNDRVILSTNYARSDSSTLLRCAFAIGSVDWKAGSLVDLGIMEAENSLGTVGVLVIGQTKDLSYPLQSYWLSSSCSSGINVNPGSTTVLVAGSFLQDKYYACAMLDPLSGTLSMRSDFVQTEAGGTAVACVMPTSDEYTAGTHKLEVFECSDADGNDSQQIYGFLSTQYFVSASWSASVLSSGDKVVPTNTTIQISGNFVNGYSYALSITANGQTVQTEYQQATVLGRSSLFFVAPLLSVYTSGDIAQVTVLQKQTSQSTPSRIIGPDPQYSLKDHVGPIPPTGCLANVTLDTVTGHADLSWSPWLDPHSSIVSYFYSLGVAFERQGLAPVTRVDGRMTSVSVPLDFTKISEGQAVSISLTAVNLDGTTVDCITSAFADGTRGQPIYADRVADAAFPLYTVGDAYLNIEVPSLLAEVISGVSYRALASADFQSNPKFVDPKAKGPDSSPPKVFSGLSFVLGGMDSNGTVMPTMALPSAVSLTIHYGDLTVDPDRVNTLALYMFDESKGEWVSASATCPHQRQQVDARTKTLYVDVCHFTQFAVFSNGFAGGWSVDLIVGLLFFAGALAIFFASSFFWSKKLRAARQSAVTSPHSGSRTSPEESRPLVGSRV